VQIPKASEDDRARFAALLPDDPRVEVKPMFGNVGAFVSGNMFAGLFGGDLGVRLPDTEAAALRASGGGAFGPEGRPTGWQADARTPDRLAAALEHVAAMPPKVRPPRAKKKA
jgi:TfoX/Sxy family transcriptional regulator of competence genes